MLRAYYAARVRHAIYVARAQRRLLLELAAIGQVDETDLIMARSEYWAVWYWRACSRRNGCDASAIADRKVGR